MKDPLVSVLIPVFNGEKYLLQALQSIQSQTYSNLEIVIVNDGSTDCSTLIIDEFLKCDTRARVIHKSRSGLTESLNAGLAAARGDYIARLDSDDWSEMTRLEAQVARIRRDSSVVLVGSDFQIFKEDSGDTRSFRLPIEHDVLLGRLRRLRSFFPHSSVLFHANTAVQVGGYDIEARYNEDWDLWLKLSEHGKVTSVPQNLVTIRTHPDQTTRKIDPTLPITEAFASSVLHHVRIRYAHDASSVQVKREDIREYLHTRPEFKKFYELVCSQVHVQEVLMSSQSSLKKVRELFHMRGILRTLVRLWIYKTRGTDTPRRVGLAWLGAKHD